MSYPALQPKSVLAVCVREAHRCTGLTRWLGGLGKADSAGGCARRWCHWRRVGNAPAEVEGTSPTSVPITQGNSVKSWLAKAAVSEKLRRVSHQTERPQCHACAVVMPWQLTKVIKDVREGRFRPDAPRNQRWATRVEAAPERSIAFCARSQPCDVHSRRFLHLSDSGCAYQGSKQLPKVNPTVRKMNLFPLWASIASLLNAADAPSRKFEPDAEGTN